jgi:hypothetical protein
LSEEKSQKEYFWTEKSRSDRKAEKITQLKLKLSNSLPNISIKIKLNTTVGCSKHANGKQCVQQLGLKPKGGDKFLEKSSIKMDVARMGCGV